MNEEIQNIIVGAIRDIGKSENNTHLQNFDKDSPLLGTLNSLDSLAFVQLMLELETRISKQFSQKFSITDEELEGTDLSDIKGLSELIEKKLS